MALTDLANYFTTQLPATGTGSIKIDQAAFSAALANNASSLIQLMGGYLGLSSPEEIVISGLTKSDIPTPGTELSISTGNSSFLNAKMYVVNLVFTFSSSGDLDFYIETNKLLPSSGSGSWTFGTSFPTASTFTTLDGQISEPTFIFSTYPNSSAKAWPAHKDLTLKQGLSFYTGITIPDGLTNGAQARLHGANSPLKTVEQFLYFFNAGTVDYGPKLFGTIDIKDPVKTSSGSTLPNIQLETTNITNTSGSFNLFEFLKVKNPRMAIRTIEFDDGIDE